MSKTDIRQFLLPQVDFHAISYREMVDINSSDVLEPPLLKPFSDVEIENLR